MTNKYITCESVTEGHPDKVSDYIADSILDALLEQDPNSRVACEVCCKTGFALLFGEITSSATINYEEIARKAIVEVGYDNSAVGFDGNICGIQIALSKQSSDIALGVNSSLENKESNNEDKYNQIGAGDQGMMFGFASDETDEYLPLAVYLSHKLTRTLAKVRKNKTLPYIRPDGKAQVTVEYDSNTGRLVRIDTVVVSTQHDEQVTNEQLHKDVKKYVIDAVLPKEYVDVNTKILINPTGRFTIGGPLGDSGLTGRKIIVDTYGAYAPHGGGAFSGKDPTKVDRSANYMCRYVAKNIVASGIAKKCMVSVAYAIGVAKPIGFSVETFGTGAIEDGALTEIVKKLFDFRPAAIIDRLDLRKPIYKKTTNYGHFGNPKLPWEKLDMVDKLKAAVDQVK